MNTGLTFGDNTSPSNWEPIARARQQLAQALWHDAKTTIDKASPYVSPFKFEPPATLQERRNFAKAIPDSLNQGVLDSSGRRKAPTYNHHVDDNMYADVAKFLPTTVSASIVALYEILEHTPTNGYRIPFRGINFIIPTAT